MVSRVGKAKTPTSALGSEMREFAFEAVDGAGREVRGVERGATLDGVRDDLSGRGLVVLDLSERKGREAARIFSRHRRDLLELTRGVGALLAAGLPARTALAASEHVAGALTHTLHDVRRRVEKGEALHLALAAHTSVFDAAYVGAVRAGERSGELASAFSEQESRLAREADIRSRLLSASIYPFVLALVGTAALVALLLFVVPRFAELVQGAGAELPRSTAAILAVAEFASTRWLPLLGASVGAALAIVAALRAPAARTAVSAAILATPLLGPTRRAVLSARVARILGTLVKGGAPLTVALRDTAESVGSGIAAAEVRRLAEKVRAGSPLRTAMAEGAVFDPLLARLVAVGEEAGRTGDFLTKAADLLEERAVRSTERLVTLIEPAMIVLFGTVIAVVAFALLQTVYGLNAGALQ